MREVFEEYGKTVLAVIAAALLISTTTVFLMDGQFFDAIWEFSQRIC